MILADKIIENRKKNGWSQEELAGMLGVSRQSVSKWESAQAVPDMKKILQLSEVFGVTTDYLIKDEIESVPAVETAPVDSGLEETVRQVSMEEANTFLLSNERAARRISTGVMLCILAPVAVVVLGGLAEAELISMGEAHAEIAGTAVLIIMVAIAVGMFIREGLRGSRYDYLEKINIDTEYGVDGMVKERRDAYAEQHSRLLIIGIMLCIIAAVPLLIINLTRYTNNTDALPVLGVGGMLVMCAVGVKLIVLTCIRQGGFDRLLEEAKRCTAVVIGCGLSVCKDTKRIVNSFIEYCEKPMLLDADALNCIADDPEILKKAKADIVITPHPGEFARLIKSTPAEVNADREKLAAVFAVKYGVTTVLKGAGTVIASPQGRVLVNHTGNSGMATGGSGDVLAGIAGALLAQGAKTFDAAAAAVYLHGLAGDIAAEKLGKISMLPSDIIECIPEALRACSVS